MSRVRVGVIGTGSMGKNHVRVYSETDDCDLVSISDLDETSLEGLQKKYNVKTYTDYEKMLDNEKLDAVTIAVPTEFHKEVALKVIERNINLLIEKPISLTVDEAEEITSAAKKAKVMLTVGHIERFNPAVKELKKRIEEGELGRFYKVDVNRIGPLPTRIKDVGVTIDLAVHDIDIVRYLTGSNPERVYAETEQRVHTSNEDILSGIIRFSNKTICYLNVNWLTPTTIRKLYLTGEKGMFVINYLDQKLFFYENEGVKEPEIIEGQYIIKEGRMIKYNVKRREPLKAELEHFVDCVKNGKKPIVTGEDGLEALKIAHSLLRSSENNEVIDY